MKKTASEANEEARKKEARKQFAERLKFYRERENLSREQLAAAAGKSVIYLYYLENHKYEGNKRTPSRSMVNALAEALGLNQAEWNELLLTIGYEPISEVARESAIDYVRRLFNDSDIGEEYHEELRREIQRSVEVWKRKKTARNQEVKKAVLPVAGWQPRLLSPATLERTVMHAVGEIAKSGIKEVIAVVARGLPDWFMQNLKTAYPNLRSRFAPAAHPMPLRRPAIWHRVRTRPAPPRPSSRACRS